MDTEDRVYDWIKWKHGSVIVGRVQAKLANAEKRRQKGTTLTLDDVRELIGLADVGVRPSA